MGYKPWDFHRITYREVLLAVEGLNEQNKFYHDLLRKATSLISASGFNHKVAASFERLWPGDQRKQGKISEAKLKELAELKAISDNQLRQLRKVEAQKSALEKIKKNA